MLRNPLLVDVSRLVTRLLRRTPTGIDRLDLAYARHVVETGSGRAVAATRLGPRLVGPAQTSRLIRSLAKRWRDHPKGDADAGLARIESWLAAPPSVPPPLPSLGRDGYVRYALGSPLRAFRNIGAEPAVEAPREAIYFHGSHIGLDQPELFRWLDRRPDIRTVFYIHDLIPIDYPEYGVPGEAERHRLRMETVARRAAGVLVNSRDVGDRFTRYLREAGLPKVAVAVAPLGVEATFLANRRSVPGARPYFVILATIEARKNHVMLLQVWRDLALRLGPATPALLVIGRRGWESENAIDLLERCPAIAPHVIEANGLPTSAVASLIAGARALLMPSFAEGYGIPIAEALSMGTPVVASDLPAHREVAAGCATLLDPLDGAGWRETIRTATLAERRATVPPGFRPPTWDDHFRIAHDFLNAL